MNLVLVTVQHRRVYIRVYIYVYLFICLLLVTHTNRLKKKNITENKEIRFTNEGKVSNDTFSGPEELIRP